MPGCDHRYHQPDKQGENTLLASGYEWLQPQQTDTLCWQERRLLVRSVAFAEAAERALDRILTLLEFVVRRRLAEDPTPLLGLYVGNPKRATLMPTAERLLEAFQEITLLILPHSGHNVRYLTPLTPLQQRILELVGVAAELYTCLCDDSHLLAQKMSDL